MLKQDSRRSMIRRVRDLGQVSIGAAVPELELAGNIASDAKGASAVEAFGDFFS